MREPVRLGPGCLELGVCWTGLWKGHVVVQPVGIFTVSLVAWIQQVARSGAQSMSGGFLNGETEASQG